MVEGGCKPDSVPRRAVFIHLDCRYRQPQAAYPEASSRRRAGADDPRLPYLALLRMGFTLPFPSSGKRCALTAPFHHHPRPDRGLSALCGTFPRVTAAGRYPACCPPGVRTFLRRKRRRTPASFDHGGSYPIPPHGSTRSGLPVLLPEKNPKQHSVTKEGRGLIAHTTFPEFPPRHDVSCRLAIPQRLGRWQGPEQGPSSVSATGVHRDTPRRRPGQRTTAPANSQPPRSTETLRQRDQPLSLFLILPMAVSGAGAGSGSASVADPHRAR